MIAVIGFSWLSAVAQLMIVARCPTSRRYQHQLLTSVPECKVNRLRLKPGKVLVHLLWSSVDPEDECKLQSQKALQHKISPSFFEHPIILTYHSYKGWVDTFDTRTKSAKKVNLTLCGRTRWSKKQFTKCLYPSHRQYPSSLMVVIFDLEMLGSVHVDALMCEVPNCQFLHWLYKIVLVSNWYRCQIVPLHSWCQINSF